MVWTSGWRLASAVSNAGGLGIIGSGSMYPDVLRTHIQKCKQATNKAFAVNIPLLYSDIDKHIDIIIQEKVPIVFTLSLIHIYFVLYKMLFYSAYTTPHCINFLY